jgi:hypothetical protein
MPVKTQAEIEAKLEPYGRLNIEYYNYERPWEFGVTSTLTRQLKEPKTEEQIRVEIAARKTWKYGNSEAAQQLYICNQATIKTLYWFIGEKPPENK